MREVAESGSPRARAAIGNATERIRGLPAPVLSLAVVGVLAVVYLRWTPLAPDLAAQVARADVVRSSGIRSWWTGWFGGLSLPSYSVLTPSTMAYIGVRATGVVAVGFGAIGAARLARGTPRPRAGAIVFAVAAMADLADGRVTFAVGLAVAVWALEAVRARRSAICIVLALVTYFASPLAGLFLGMALMGVGAVDRSRRTPSAVAAGVLLLTGATMAVLFPGTGTMPFTLLDALPAALCCAGVVLVCPQRLVRVTGGIVLAAMAAFLIVPGAVGDNITRLSWVCAAPVVAACAPLPRRLVALSLGLLSIWPLADLTEQASHGHATSAQASYYQPLAQALASQRSAAGAGALGERLELVDTANHWGSVYLAARSLARGWDRQADNANNPLFYRPDALTSSTYQQWLHQLAVGWVALPAAPLDYASVAEGALVRSGLPYLHLVWTSPRWRLYRVIDATPLAIGARVTAVDDGSLTVTSLGPATVNLQVRWSPYLTIKSPTNGTPPAGCVANDDGWTILQLPAAETVQLTSDFSPEARLLGSASGCPPHTP